MKFIKIKVNTLNSHQKRKRRASEEDKPPSPLDNPEKKPATDTMLTMKALYYPQPQSRLQKMTADIISHPRNPFSFSPFPSPKQQPPEQPLKPQVQPQPLPGPIIIQQSPSSPNTGGGDEVDDAADTMDYRFEQTRLDSFENWPCPYVRPNDLAAAGFYYTKHIDLVRCFECRAEICKWEENDDPMAEHQRWGGRCRFIRKLPCGNVPIGADPETIPMPRSRSEDVCGPYRLEYRPCSEDDTNASSSTNNSSQPILSASKLGCLGIGIPKRPNFPEYTTYEARLQTFEDWPVSMPQKKEELANAGFFYTKTGDHTTCYCCGVGLKDWEPQDDPWVQHARWFSTCYYVLLVKGQEFINSVTGKAAQSPTEEETKQINLPNPMKKLEIPIPEKSKEESEESTQSNNSANNTTEVMEVIANTEMTTENEQQSQEIKDPQTRSLSQLSTGSSQESTSSCTSGSKKSLDDARTCKICYNEELGVAFLPCGHTVSCVKCAPSMTVCAVCREPIAMVARIFFS